MRTPISPAVAALSTAIVLLAAWALSSVTPVLAGPDPGRALGPPDPAASTPLGGPPWQPPAQLPAYAVWQDGDGLVHVRWWAGESGHVFSGHAVGREALRPEPACGASVVVVDGSLVFTSGPTEAGDSGEWRFGVRGPQLGLWLSVDGRAVTREQVHLGRDGVTAPAVPLLLEVATGARGSLRGG